MTRILVAAGALAVTAFASAQYAKQGVRLNSYMSLTALEGGASGAGCAPYVAPSGQEYAIMGVRNGTAIVRITNPAAPFKVATIAGTPSTWHEMTTCGEYLYSVADGVDQGMQIIDLTRVDQNIVELKSTYTVNNIKRVHTIQANPASKTLYLNGGSGVGIVMLNINDPLNPVEVGRWNTKYVHDCQVKSFTSGPYAGREIAFLCCGGNGLYIVDVTNKAVPVILSNLPYLTGSYYSHSGQLNQDGTLFFINDEFDERNAIVPDCSTHVVDVSNLSAPIYKGKFVNPIGVIDHNTQRVGNILYLAAYRAGLRIYDITTAQNIGSNPQAIVEKGFFDTYPEGQGFSFDGAWGTAAFPSGTVIISDINRGLFVLDPSEALGVGAPLTELVNLGGTVISGGIASLRNADEVSYDVNCGLDNPNGSRLWTRFELSAETTITPSAFLDVTVKAKPQVTVIVELWNWTTGQYVNVGSLPLDDTSGTIPNLAGSSYISSEGKIKGRFTGLPFMNGSRSMLVLKFDQIKFNVRRS